MTTPALFLDLARVNWGTVALVFAYFLNFLAVIGVVFVERRSQTSAILWCVVLVILPVVGLVFYIFLGKGPSFGRRKKFLNKYYKDNTYCKEMENQIRMISERSQALAELGESEEGQVRQTLGGMTLGTLDQIEQQTDQIHYNLTFEGNLCSIQNEVKIYTDIREQYDEMIGDIKKAKSFVNVLYYIIQPDESGERLRQALLDKAKEGVHVRLVYDSMGGRHLYKEWFYELQDEGVEIVEFFPSKLRFFNLNVNYRLHRKIVVVDNLVGYMGGANIGDEYLGKQKKTRPWRDTHLRLEGESVFLLNLRFMQDFNFAKGCDQEPQPFNPDCLKEAGQLPVQIISDGPDTAEGIIESCYIKAIYSARKRVWIQTPYLIPDEIFLEALKSAARSGIDVRIMIPGRPDKKFVYYCTLSYAAELAEAGCKIYKWEGFIHSKTLLVDDGISSVGSFNIDIRSFKLNFELTAFIYGADFGRQMAGIYEADIERSTLYDMEAVKKRSLWQRFKERLMRLASPIF